MNIRRLEKQDLEYANELRNKYIDFLRQVYPHNLKQQETWFNITSDIYWVVYEYIEGYLSKDDYDLLCIIGLTNVNLKDKNAELSLITQDYLIKEYADFALDFVEKYAFEKLSLNKLYITVFEWDEKKIEYFKNRYTLECFLREDVMYKGKYYNHYYFSKLAKEYFK